MHIKNVSKVRKADDVLQGLKDLLAINSAFGFSLKADEDKVLLAAEEGEGEGE